MKTLLRPKNSVIPFTLAALITLILGTHHSNAACNATSCTLPLMPILNQKDPALGSALLPNGPSKSMLCGPISVTMALLGISTAAKKGIKSGSFTDDLFTFRGSEAARAWELSLFHSPTSSTAHFVKGISQMVKLLGTNVYDSVSVGNFSFPGTFTVYNGINARTGDFEDAASYTAPGYLAGAFPTLGQDDYDNILAGSQTGGRQAAGVIGILEYEKTCVGSKWFKACAWNPYPSKGHLVAVEGFTEGKIVDGKYVGGRLIIHDPQTGRIRYSAVEGAGIPILRSDAKRLTDWDGDNKRWVIHSAHFIGAK